MWIIAPIFAHKNLFIHLLIEFFSMEKNQEKTDFKSIEEKSVFGCYSQNENKVTLALLKVLECAVADGDGLLAKLVDKAGDKELPSSQINLTCQVTDTDEHSIPDGRISCNYAFDYLIESKLGNHINRKQLDEHLKTLRNQSGTKLIYITTHPNRPKELTGMENVLWLNWTNVTELLEDYIAENQNPVLVYLVRQFELLVNRLGIYDDGGGRVIIVGGRRAIPVAQKYHFYACQANRTFNNAEYIAFLCNKEISNIFRIEELIGESVDLRDYPEVVPPEYLEQTEPDYAGEPRKLFKLGDVTEFTIKVEDDSLDKNGNPCAYAQRQAYTTIDKIKSAKRTSQLRG